MKKLLLMIMLLLVAALAYSKDIVVNGTVTDDIGEVLPGASVIVKGTTIGVSVDIDGKYSIKVPDGHKTLVFKFLGLVTKEIAVPANDAVIDVKLEPESALLDEVVVTGYGTYKKSAYAGSASTVKLENMEDMPAVDFSTMLQGNAPGVQINSTSGQPGSATDIMIRGLGSFNASKSPLYVIDGVPVMSGNVNSGNSDVGTDIMSTISPSDIENITVIKDAAAASLYGSRAANGVILITTKSGKEGRASFNLKADWGFSDIATKYRETMSGAERRETLYEGLMNKAKYVDGKTDPAEIKKYADDNINKYAPLPYANWEERNQPKELYADWEDALFRKGSHKNYEFSATGGDKKLSYFSSLGYTEQEGITYQSAFRRISGRVNVKYKITSQLELGANILFSNIKQDTNSEGGTYTSPIYSTRHKVTPSDPIYNEDGTYNEKLLANERRNPKAASDHNSKVQKINRSLNTIFANYKIMDNLLAHSTLSYDNTNAKYNSWDDPKTSDGFTDKGNLTKRMDEFKQLVWKNNLTYTKEFAEKHNIDVLAGFELDMYTHDFLETSVKGFPNSNSGYVSNAADVTSYSGVQNDRRLISYLSRANYNYMDKYFAGASIRTDATSKLHKDSRWGTFWSASGAWRISEETFMQPFREVLSETKLRASYGTNGTLPNDYFGYMNLVTYDSKYMSETGVYEKKIADKNLKWEKNYNLNLGLDFRLFNRLGVTVEYYNRQTKDLLMDMPISATTGFTKYLTNIGEVENQGFELDLNLDVLRKSIYWNTSLNIGHNKNKIKNLGGQDEIRSTYTILRVGESYYSYFLYEFAGINPDNGNPLYYKNQGEDPRDKTENLKEATPVLYKGAEPNLTGGWTNSLKYKFVDLSFTFTFSLGGYSYDRAASKLDHGGSEMQHQIQAYYRDRWKEPGDNAKYEMFITERSSSTSMSSIYNSRRVHSTDHLRLKNLTIGFSLPKKLSNAVKLGNVRAYCSAVNLLTFAAYDGYDPEVPRNGEVYFISPKLKTITFGLDIKF